MTALLVISFLIFLGALAYYFWERSIAFDRQFVHQIRIDLYRWKYHIEDRFLDRKNLINTAFEIPVEKLMLPLSLRDEARKYQATPYRVLENVFTELSVFKLLHYNFIDLGCGAGRVLILAYRFGFRKIIGLEADRNLVRICEENLRQYPHLYRSSRVEHVTAEKFIFPPGPAVIFMFNPFTEKILQQSLEHLMKQPGKKIIVYVNPVYEQFLLEAGATVLIQQDHYHKDFSYKVYQMPEPEKSKLVGESKIADESQVIGKSQLDHSALNLS